MAILARPLRSKSLSSIPQAVMTAGITAVLVATGGGATATAQPSTSTTSPTSPAPAVLPQQEPTPVDPCATTPSATTTTSASPTTTSTAPASCTTIPEQTPATQSTAPDATTTVATATPSAETTAPTPAGKRIPYTGLPTENPNSTLIPGKMRSDREEWPEGYTKEQADQAEIGEALLIAKQRTSRSAVTCQRYWPTSFDVCGAIRDKYNSLGGVGSFLFLPTSGNIVNPGGTGERVTFVNGPIYWSAAGGAHPVVNSFLNRWGVLGYEGGWLGYPTTDEILLPDGGRRQEFRGGAVYVAFQNAIGSAIRNGPVREKWNTIGGNAPGGSALGYVTGDEIGLPDGQGRMARFERGVIYWHPTHGAHTVVGDILTVWADNFYEAGDFGYPVTDQTATTTGFTQEFQYGAKLDVDNAWSGILTETEASGGRACPFVTRTDKVHVSTSRNPNGTPKGPPSASGHGWWVDATCKSNLTATVHVQLQYLDASGVWVDRIGPETNRTEYGKPAGSGKGKWVYVNDPCQGFGKRTWRTVVDVDINGVVDGPTKGYAVPNEIPCS